MMRAINLYRQEFEPSEQLAKPHVILGYNICAADTEAEALLLRSSGLQAFLNLRQGNPGPLPKPNENFEEALNDADRAMLQQVSPASAVGTVDSVRSQVQEFLQRTEADELIVVSQIHDHQARCKSYDIAYEACAGL
jgi:alkanesulfonate monooxygenase SsuD/methylene tetrahydromethanopterin reductase-like flavin-dependent oxidoreductase (luciferase family)